MAWRLPKAVETSQVLNDIVPQAMGTAGRLSMGETGRILLTLRWHTKRLSGSRGAGEGSACPGKPVGRGPFLPPRRRPAVPVACETISFRTWDVSTPCGRPANRLGQTATAAAERASAGSRRGPTKPYRARRKRNEGAKALRTATNA